MKYKFIGYLYIIIGIGIIGLWIMLLITKQVPEIETAFFEILLHIIIETIMGFLCIASGYFYFKQRRYFKELCLITNGFLIYSVINSSGYYIQSGDFFLVIMFYIILAFALYSTSTIITQRISK